MQRAQIGYCLADSKSAFWLLAALKRDFNITEIKGVSTPIITEALASAVEQSAYVWYARESLNAVPVPVEARTVADQINDPDSKRCAIALCCSLPSH